MTDFPADPGTMLAALRRPRILVRAARCGVADYRRDRDLRRLLRLPKTAVAARALETLLAEEQRLETIRTTGEATYSLQRHVAVLTALLAEAHHARTGPAVACEAVARDVQTGHAQIGDAQIGDAQTGHAQTSHAQTSHAQTRHAQTCHARIRLAAA